MGFEGALFPFLLEGGQVTFVENFLQSLVAGRIGFGVGEEFVAELF